MRNGELIHIQIKIANEQPLTYHEKAYITKQTRYDGQGQGDKKVKIDNIRS